MGALWPPGSVEFSDSDEEDERVGPGLGNSHVEELTSFPVDSWEDTWDDSDAPVSQEVLTALFPLYTSPFTQVGSQFALSSPLGNHCMILDLVVWIYVSFVSSMVECQTLLGVATLCSLFPYILLASSVLTPQHPSGTPPVDFT